MASLKRGYFFFFPEEPDVSPPGLPFWMPSQCCEHPSPPLLSSFSVLGRWLSTICSYEGSWTSSCHKYNWAVKVRKGKRWEGECQPSLSLGLHLIGQNHVSHVHPTCKTVCGGVYFKLGILLPVKTIEVPLVRKKGRMDIEENLPVSATDSKGSLHSTREHCFLRASGLQWSLCLDTDSRDRFLTLNPSPAPYYLCAPGPVAVSFHASFSSSIKFGEKITAHSQYCHRVK